jgi:hypothetical protein
MNFTIQGKFNCSSNHTSKQALFAMKLPSQKLPGDSIEDIENSELVAKYGAKGE